MPGARQVIATNSGHYIQLAQPELVVDATRAVVDAVRLGETQLGPGELADTGSPSWLLVAIATTLTASAKWWNQRDRHSPGLECMMPPSAKIVVAVR